MVLFTCWGVSFGQGKACTMKRSISLVMQIASSPSLERGCYFPTLPTVELQLLGQKEVASRTKSTGRTTGSTGWICRVNPVETYNHLVMFSRWIIGRYWKHLNLVKEYKRKTWKEWIRLFSKSIYYTQTFHVRDFCNRRLLNIIKVKFPIHAIYHIRSLSQVTGWLPSWPNWKDVPIGQLGGHRPVAKVDRSGGQRGAVMTRPKSGELLGAGVFWRLVMSFCIWSLILFVSQV